MKNNKKKSMGLVAEEKINIYELFPPEKEERTPSLENNDPIPFCYSGFDDEIDLIAR